MKIAHGKMSGQSSAKKIKKKAKKLGKLNTISKQRKIPVGGDF